MTTSRAGTIRDRLERLVLAHARLPRDRVLDGDVLGHEFGFDSRAFLGLLLAVEDHFGIEVPPEQVGALAGQPFGRLLAAVEQAVGSAGREEAQR